MYIYTVRKAAKGIADFIAAKGVDVYDKGEDLQMIVCESQKSLHWKYPKQLGFK
ncbi:hypothetical protein [Cytobacillus firmus]|uniref:hypothetical protein n=1 Tax=Cytobacillus firmus TaxID=1399 RepID=UPI001CFE026C|nr:hypothetical protein [Cytobacillus firmus]WHY64191.1 hypothetical protein QNH42_12680 [Cytobacillus firmus]